MCRLYFLYGSVIAAYLKAFWLPVCFGSFTVRYLSGSWLQGLAVEGCQGCR